ncbi:hypothetical protein F5B20DRAFT_585730 [Whalleya microplaca]|nr:hypothetical protein F5B20DRAFT_585730 [Whalleya microplaca]
MTKVQKSNPDGPSRSDSFLRMLELEKRYKMQRIHGHSSVATTGTSPSTSSPSAPSDTPFKARRASGHPPLSHQTQIMKAVRRSSALPSLSISIPPSSPETPAARTDGPVEEPKPKKEEATKTVTFSDPDEVEDDIYLSDQSSICQSPSWEQYGRKKKKKPKKQEAEHDKKGEEKPASTLKKKGNRLSKAPLQPAQGIQQLGVTDRARSAPELDLYPRPDKATTAPFKSTPPDTMATQKNSHKFSNQDVNGKPKNRKFLSGFRLQHGNVSAVQKIITSRTSIDDSMQKPHGGDSSFSTPRKPPSIRSFVSNSTRSISSLDQLPPVAPHSSGSSHGRSQSLLSSTLSKLRGPSYLYYKTPDNANDTRPHSSREPDTGSNQLIDRPSGRHSEQQVEHARSKLMSSAEPPTENLPQFTFPPKPKRATTQPTPGDATRAPQIHVRIAEPGDMSKFDSPEPTSSRDRHIRVPPPRAPARQLAIEKDKQYRAERPSRAPRQPLEDVRKVNDTMTKIVQEERAFERKRNGTRQVHAHRQPQGEVWVDPNNMSRAEALSQEDNALAYDNQLDYVDANSGRHQEDDQVSIDTHASTIRPASRSQDRSPPERNARNVPQTLPNSPNKIGRAVTSDGVNECAKSSIAEPAEVKQYAPIEPPPRAERSADYFSFISESYAPPSLELRAPVDGRFPSPRIEEEPEESEEDMLGRFSAKQHPKETVISSSKLDQAPTSNVSVTTRTSKDKQSKDSPSMSSHHSDSDVPIFERLGISPKAAKILAGVETSSTSTSQSQTEPSRTTSERSSSSTYDDAPPSPSSATTPDSSRPQSRKGFTAPQVDTVKNTAIITNGNNDERIPHKSYKAPSVEPPAKSSSRSIGRDDEIRNRMAGSNDLQSRSTVTLNRFDNLASGPPLVSSPTSVTFADDVKDDIEIGQSVDKSPYRQPIPPRAQSALELHSTNFVPTTKHYHPLINKMKNGASSVSLPTTPPAELTEEPHRKSAMKVPRNGSSNSEEPSALITTGAAYLQEARKAAPIPPTSSSRALRPQYTPKTSSSSIRSAVGAEGRAEPLAKMLVECCSCKFFHDMPSRVYECMAKPDSVVEDKLLGVSAAITTMVKCPWCGHGMTTQCCSGYAAVVFLKEKLHGK